MKSWFVLAWDILFCTIGFTFLLVPVVCYMLLSGKAKDAVVRGWCKAYDEAKPNRKDVAVQRNSPCVIVTACAPEGRTSHPHSNN